MFIDTAVLTELEKPPPPDLTWLDGQKASASVCAPAGFEAAVPVTMWVQVFPQTTYAVADAPAPLVLFMSTNHEFAPGIEVLIFWNRLLEEP